MDGPSRPLLRTRRIFHKRLILRRHRPIYSALATVSLVTCCAERPAAWTFRKVRSSHSVVVFFSLCCFHSVNEGRLHLFLRFKEGLGYSHNLVLWSSRSCTHSHFLCVCLDALKWQHAALFIICCCDAFAVDFLLDYLNTSRTIGAQRRTEAAALFLCLSPKKTVIISFVRGLNFSAFVYRGNCRLTVAAWQKHRRMMRACPHNVAPMDRRPDPEANTLCTQEHAPLPPLPSSTRSARWCFSRDESAGNGCSRQVPTTHVAVESHTARSCHALHVAGFADFLFFL